MQYIIFIIQFLLAHYDESLTAHSGVVLGSWRIISFHKTFRTIPVNTKHEYDDEYILNDDHLVLPVFWS